MTEPNRANSAHARQIYYQPLDVALLLRTHDGLYKTGYKIASIFINKNIMFCRGFVHVRHFVVHMLLLAP